MTEKHRRASGTSEAPSPSALERQLEACRQRLVEAEERQAATSEILRVISGSPEGTQPVFDAIVRSGFRLFSGAAISIALPDGDIVRAAAVAETDPERAASWKSRFPFPLTREYMHGVALLEGREVDIPDVADAPSGLRPGAQNFLATGYRAVTMMPLIREGEAIGVLSVVRLDPGRLSNEQLALLRTFAAQAVIAIENTRLVNALRTRTTELERSYALVRQQADQLRTQSEQLSQLNENLERKVSEQVAEIERMGRLRRFLSPQVADLIVSSGAEDQLQSHRREITAVFCDLRGFTAFAESADPEDLMRLMKEYHAALGRIIHEYEGTLERFAGDGVMVVFNDPVELPNPQHQAVRMAMDIRISLGELLESWRRMGYELGVGIGISHGYATLGTIGFEGRLDYAAIGTVANVASRLCDEAKSGQILISSRVLLAVENDVATEPRGELTLKGIRRPVAVFSVT